MTRLRRVPPEALTLAAVLVGLALALTGLYGLLGLDWTLLVGGVVLVVAGLVVDLG